MLSLGSVLGVDLYDVTVGVRGCVQDGATPMFIAALNGHKHCVEALLSAGAEKGTAVEHGRAVGASAVEAMLEATFAPNAASTSSSSASGSTAAGAGAGAGAGAAAKDADNQPYTTRATKRIRLHYQH